jgi:hypothetical protein
MPVRSHMDRAARVAKRNDLVRLDALKILRAVLRKAADDPEQVAKDAQLPKADAPFYLHVATQVGAESIRSSAAEAGGTGTTLNVLIMGQAPSNEAWLEAVKQSQQPKAIDAVAVPSAKEPKT